MQILMAISVSGISKLKNVDGYIARDNSY